jgi:transcriptional regulator with XRE-family HTH domain
MRQCLGLTQEEFAEHAGLSYKFYQQIESGRKKQVWLQPLDRFGILSLSNGLAGLLRRCASANEPSPDIS